MAQQQERGRAKQKSIDQRIADVQEKQDLQKNSAIHRRKVIKSTRDCLEATKGISLHDDIIPRDRNGAVYFPQLDIMKHRRSNSL